MRTVLLASLLSLVGPGCEPAAPPVRSAFVRVDSAAVAPFVRTSRPLCERLSGGAERVTPRCLRWVY